MFILSIRKYFFLAFSSFCSFLIITFFISHIFWGDRSFWKISDLNKEILVANKKLNELLSNKNDISLEIDLLREGKVDSDIVSEISQKTLGLIQPDQIVIKIPK